jgi:hypothetical protein
MLMVILVPPLWWFELSRRPAIGFNGVKCFVLSHSRGFDVGFGNRFGLL